MKNLLALCLLFVACNTSADLSGSIDNQIQQMENAVTGRQPLEIAQVYHDEGYIINPEGIEASGRKAIDEYWNNLGGRSTDWQLETLATANTMSELTATTAWKELPRIPKLPGELNISLPASEKMIYQLGRSHLTYEGNKGPHTSVVNFLGIWRMVNGEYRLWLDSYASAKPADKKKEQ